MINLEYLLQFFGLLFIIGCIGICLKRENCLLALISIELMYLGIIFSFIVFAKLQNLTYPYIWSLIILIIAACESAIGLGILVTLYKKSKSVSFYYYRTLHG